MIGLLTLTLIFNRTTFINFDKSILTIQKRNFLLIQTFKQKIDIMKIDKFEIEEFINESFFPGDISSFGSGHLVGLFTGLYFYLPRFKIIISEGDIIRDIEINTGRKDFKVLESKLKEILKKKLVRIEN